MAATPSRPRPHRLAVWLAIACALVVVGLSLRAVLAQGQRVAVEGTPTPSTPSPTLMPASPTTSPMTSDTGSTRPALTPLAEPAAEVADPRVECGVADPPPGFAFGPGGRPFPAGANYEPADAYNPMALTNFVWAVIRHDAFTPEQLQCLTLNAGRWLMAGSTTTTLPDGSIARWFPYPFAYSVNPAAPALVPGWRSGLAQGAALGLLSALDKRSAGEADPEPWLAWGDQVLNSFLVPYSEGGFTHEITVDGQKQVWFEEYPTGERPTSVLNGHDVAVIGLQHWAERTGDPRAAELYEAGLAAVRAVLPLVEVAVEGDAVMTAYDLVRGNDAAPLRLVAGDGATVTSSRLDGSDVHLPVVAAPPSARDVLAGGAFDTAAGWSLFGSASIQAGRLSVAPDGERSGATVTVPAGTFASGAEVVLSFRSVAQYPTASKGMSPYVRVWQNCGSGGGTQLLSSGTHRAAEWTQYHRSFVIADGACDTRVTLGTLGDETGTVVRYDDVQLRLADAEGEALAPTYDFFVWRTPHATLRLEGSGAVTLQARADGVWQDVQRIVLADGESTEVVVPERFTGRNLNYKYHESSHVHEMETLTEISGDPVFAEAARRWYPLALRHP